MKMHSLARLEANNFRLLAANYIMPKGMIYIGGDNHDSTLASSNMSGKTTFLTLITYALYGCDLSGKILHNDAIKIGKTSCRVEVELDCIGQTIVVTRTRDKKRTGRIDEVTLYVDSEEGESNKRGSPDEIQSEIDERFGPMNLFLAAHIFTSERGTIPMALATDGQKKQILDLLIDAGDLDVAHDKASRRVKTLSETQNALGANMETIRVQLGAIVDNTLEATRIAQDGLKSIHTRIQSYERLKLSLEVQGRENQAKLDVVDTQIEGLVDAQDRIRSSKKAVVALAGSLQDRILEIRKRRDDLRRHISLSKVPACPTCLQPIEVSAQISILNQFDRLEAKESAKLHRNTKHLDSLKIKFTAAITRTDMALEPRNILVDLRFKLSNEIQSTVNEIKSLSAQLRLLDDTQEEAENSDTRRRNELKHKLVESGLQLRRTKQDLQAATFWLEGFGPKGIKAYRLDKITPRLNALAMKYSVALFGDGTRVVYATQKQNKNGTLREDFQIRLVDVRQRSIDFPSSGQATRRDIIHTLTLADLARELGKRSVDLLVFDEVFKTLDIEGILAVVSILDDKAKEYGTILVSEHNDELRAYFNREIIIVRERNVARIA